MKEPVIDRELIKIILFHNITFHSTIKLVRLPCPGFKNDLKCSFSIK